MTGKPHLVIVAGEDSGDLHGANLALALQKQQPGIHLSGIGGQRMRQAGVEIVFPSDRLAVVGIAEVLSRISDIWAGRKAIITHLRQQQPQLLVLIDFPDFNLNLVAPSARRLGIPIVYYISPQVWAWRRGRIKSIDQRVEKILVILPFEEEFYRQHGVRAEYVGHPLLDEYQDFSPRPKRERQNTIALIPGSRSGEIKRLLPLMLTVAQLYRRRRPETRFIIPAAPSVASTFISSMIPQTLAEHITLGHGGLPQALEKVAFALVASGTATLECALAQVPMIVLYRVNPLSYEIGRRLISVPCISLVNLIAEQKIVPELIQHEARPELVSAALRLNYENHTNYIATRTALKALKTKLGKPGGAGRAAAAILEVWKQHG